MAHNVKRKEEKFNIMNHGENAKKKHKTVLSATVWFFLAISFCVPVVLCELENFHSNFSILL